MPPPAREPSPEDGMARPLPPLRTVTAVYPSPALPRRGHFIEAIHRHLEERYASEILAPRVLASDPLEEERHGAAVRRFPYPSRGRLPKAAGVSLPAAAAYLLSAGAAARRRWPRGDRLRGGLVLAHWVLPAGWIAARVARRLGLPLVLYAHGSDLHHHGRRFPGRLLLRPICRDARRIVAARRELASIAIEGGGADPARVRVLPVGIDPLFAPSTEPPPPPPPVRCLFVGALLEPTGVEASGQALEILGRRRIDVTLTLVGDGPLAAPLRARELPRLRILGELDADRVRREMARAHLLLLPSRGEGTPLVLQEAIAMALPVAATPVGGIADLFEARSGWHPLPAGAGGEEIARVVGDLALRGAAGVSER
ncbi:MAG: glycosyltransferase, partial [Planctomycetota bacterium]